MPKYQQGLHPESVESRIQREEKAKPDGNKKYDKIFDAGAGPSFIQESGRFPGFKKEENECETMEKIAKPLSHKSKKVASDSTFSTSKHSNLLKNNQDKQNSIKRTNFFNKIEKFLSKKSKSQSLTKSGKKITDQMVEQTELAEKLGESISKYLENKKSDKISSVKIKNFNNSKINKRRGSLTRMMCHEMAAKEQTHEELRHQLLNRISAIKETTSLDRTFGSLREMYTGSQTLPTIKYIEEVQVLHNIRRREIVARSLRRKSVDAPVLKFPRLKKTRSLTNEKCQSNEDILKNKGKGKTNIKGKSRKNSKSIIEKNGENFFEIKETVKTEIEKNNEFKKENAKPKVSNQNLRGNEDSRKLKESRISSEQTKRRMTKMKSISRKWAEPTNVLDKIKMPAFLLFAQDCLRAHNLYRARHTAPPFQLSRELCISSQTWADYLADSELLFHKGNAQIGETIFCRNVALLMKTKSKKPDISGEEVVAYWYTDVRNYRFNLPDSALQAHAGSFSQMVWKNVKYFGVGKALSRSGKLIVVANYYPAGNKSNEFRENVLPLSIRALATEILGYKALPAHEDETTDKHYVKALKSVGVPTNGVLAAHPPNITGRNATKIVAAKMLGYQTAVVSTADEKLEVIVLKKPDKETEDKLKFKKKSKKKKLKNVDTNKLNMRNDVQVVKSALKTSNGMVENRTVASSKNVKFDNEVESLTTAKITNETELLKTAKINNETKILKTAKFDNEAELLKTAKFDNEVDTTKKVKIDNEVELLNNKEVNKKDKNTNNQKNLKNEINQCLEEVKMDNEDRHELTYDKQESDLNTIIKNVERCQNEKLINNRSLTNTTDKTDSILNSKNSTYSSKNSTHNPSPNEDCIKMYDITKTSEKALKNPEEMSEFFSRKRKISKNVHRTSKNLEGAVEEISKNLKIIPKNSKKIVSERQNQIQDPPQKEYDTQILERVTNSENIPVANTFESKCASTPHLNTFPQPSRFYTKNQRLIKTISRYGYIEVHKL